MGCVSGKICYGKLVIDEGGELCGDINVIFVENCIFICFVIGLVSEFVLMLNVVVG